MTAVRKLTPVPLSHTTIFSRAYRLLSSIEGMRSAVHPRAQHTGGCLHGLILLYTFSSSSALHIPVSKSVYKGSRRVRNVLNSALK